MRSFLQFGWANYYFNLLVLNFMSHRGQLEFLQQKAEVAERCTDPAQRHRILLHCTDWPTDLLQSSQEVEDAWNNRKEMEALRLRMLERYQKERMAQGR